VIDYTGGLGLSLLAKSLIGSGVCGALIDMLDALVQQVPVERGLELRSVVRLDGFDAEGQLGQYVVDELDRGLLIVLG
jgi:hypothetical protein